jgi:hypothetical protein
VPGASDILACQRRLAALLEQMVTLARDGQWKQLPTLDAQCIALAGQLREMQPPPALSESQGMAIAELFSRIGAGQDELDGLVRPQFIALMRRIGEQHRPHDRMRGRKQPTTHDPEKCPPGGARSSAGSHPH